MHPMQQSQIYYNKNCQQNPEQLIQSSLASLNQKCCYFIPTQYFFHFYFQFMKSPSLTDACSNLARYFELQRHLDNHAKRIKNAQPTLRVTKQNFTKSHTHIKKQPLAEFNRIMTIDIENKALLKKLTDKSPSRIGKERPYKITKNNSRKFLQEYKQKQQNEGLMKRIKLAKSSYLNMKFASERRVTERYINTISKFGYKNFTPNKTIMMPFYKRAQQDMKIQRNSVHKENIEAKINVKQIDNPQQNVDRGPQIDTIVRVEKRQWQMDELTAQISYIEWVKKVTIQINPTNEDQLDLTIPKETFVKNFENSFRTVHKNIKYDFKEKGFYLDLPKQMNSPV